MHIPSSYTVIEIDIALEPWPDSSKPINVIVSNKVKLRLQEFCENFVSADYIYKYPVKLEETFKKILYSRSALRNLESLMQRVFFYKLGINEKMKKYNYHSQLIIV